MKTKHIQLQITEQETQTLKNQFTALTNAIESNKFATQADISPLTNSLAQVVNTNSQLSDLLKTANNSDEFFVVNLQHHDPEILNLPWGMAVDNHSNKQLNDLRQIYFTKGLLSETGDAFPEISTELAPLPLKILVMVSSPEDATYQNRLSFENEERSILHAFEPLYSSDNVEVHFTNNGSIEELRSKIEINKYHILHFSGHGIFSKGKGYLMLEDEYSLKNSKTSGHDFAKALLREDGYKIPLIMLSACQTMAGSVEKGFHNVTYDLLQHGFPNVLAMSMSVMDYYATMFAKEFYSKINKGNSILQAFWEAGLKIRVDEQNQFQKAGVSNLVAFQHAIPNLYSRTTQFHLFDPQAKTEKVKL